MLRVAPDADPDQVDRAVRAADVAGTPVELTLAVDMALPSSGRQATRPATVEDAATAAGRLDPATRVRVVGSPEDAVLAMAADVGAVVDLAPVSGCGRVELRHWLHEQVVTRSRHRYGNVEERP